MTILSTKTGDTGQTSLRDGVRVDKDDLRIEVNGQIDHLNALLGMVRTLALPDDELTLLHRVQCEFMVIMSHVATPDGHDNPRPLHVAELTAQMERAIDRMISGKSLGFTIPGDNPDRALVHVARTQTRTVERRLWTLHRQHPQPADVLIFFNRLSDYLFALTL